MKALQNDFFLGAGVAIIFSAFLYLAYFGITIKILNSFLGVLALGSLLYIPKRAILFSGFFIGLLWFYWIGYSFKYQGVGYMTPIVFVGFGFVYMLFFAPLSLTDKPYIRALLIFLLSFVEPFDFNWMKFELLFTQSYFGIYKYQLAIILAVLSSIGYLKKKRYGWVVMFMLLFAIDWNNTQPSLAPLKIKLVQTNVPQELKWQPQYMYTTLDMIFHQITQATKQGYDVVVLPESVFPLFMNKYPGIEAQLKKRSHDIAIVAGALYKDGKHNYNVTYVFDHSTVQMAKKMVLVPFGEYIPLPKFAQKFINDTFFAGASDFETAKKPTDFHIRGITFRNAICYEATCDEIYQNTPQYVIAMSNNGWFTPSIEPTLQKLLMHYYSRKYHVVIYHSANIAGTGIVR